MKNEQATQEAEQARAPAEAAPPLLPPPTIPVLPVPHVKASWASLAPPEAVPPRPAPPNVPAFKEPVSPAGDVAGTGGKSPATPAPAPAANVQQHSEPAKREAVGVIVTALGSVPAGTLLDETALAEVLRISKRTVRAMVGRYELPPPQSFAGRSTWIAGRVLVWVNTRAERLEREAEKRAEKVWQRA